MRVTLFLVALALLLSTAFATINKEQDAVASLSKLISSLEDTLPVDSLEQIEEEDDLALGASGVSGASGSAAPPAIATILELTLDYDANKCLQNIFPGGATTTVDFAAQLSTALTTILGYSVVIDPAAVVCGSIKFPIHVPLTNGQNLDIIKLLSDYSKSNCPGVFCGFNPSATKVLANFYKVMSVKFLITSADILETNNKGVRIVVATSQPVPSDGLKMGLAVPISCVQNANTRFETILRFVPCPPSLMIEVGKSWASFWFQPIDNTIIDGTTRVSIVINSMLMDVHNGGLVAQSAFTGDISGQIVEINIMDNDISAPIMSSGNNVRCSPLLPSRIAISNAGDVLANQEYTQCGARGIYYCNFCGVTRNNWALGIRSQNYLQGMGRAEAWQLWWNPFNQVGGGEIRYESQNTNRGLSGLLGPYAAVKGFSSAGGIVITVVTASTFAMQQCLQVTFPLPTGVIPATPNKFAGFYAFEDNTAAQVIRYRAVRAGASSYIITYQTLSSGNTVFAANTGYWYISIDNDYAPYYVSVGRSSISTTIDVTDARGFVKGTNTGVSVNYGNPVVAFVADTNCPILAVPASNCVVAYGSLNQQVNQIYKQYVAPVAPVTTSYLSYFTTTTTTETLASRLDIWLGVSYTAYSISSFRTTASSNEPWAGYYFIAFGGKQVYYTNERSLAIDGKTSNKASVTSTYYPYQATNAYSWFSMPVSAEVVTVEAVACPVA